jgi:glycosyltransferase involved in cell wall biosynthesis
MPSIYEGFGLPILEAMSCGCPVVASRGGSLVGVVGKAGEYVDPYDIDSIAEGIKRVFNSIGLQRELSQKGEIQSRKFTWKKTADETMKVYKSTISSE